MVTTVGLLSPGDMGQAIGGVLRANGLHVLTCLQGRSERTRGLAAAAEFDDAPDLESLVRDADILLCVLVPARAVEVAGQVAAALGATGADLLYVDCNAIAPRTVREVGQIVAGAGGRVADIGIIGSPPRGTTATRFYADIEGHPKDRGVALALEELAFFSRELTLLGTYRAHPYRFESAQLAN